MQYKEAFQKKYEQLTNFNDYWKAINNPPERKSIRTNTLLTTPQQLRQTLEQQGYTLEPLPWCKEGFYIGKGPEALGNLQEHKKGYYYIQASTSMIPPIILNPQPGEVVLDCCAAPGGKTTHLAMLMKNQGALVANEADGKRIGILIDNIQRMQAKNVVITKVKIQDERDIVIAQAELNIVIVPFGEALLGTVRVSEGETTNVFGFTEN